MTVSDPFSSSMEYFKPKNLKLFSVFILIPALAFWLEEKSEYLGIY